MFLIDKLAYVSKLRDKSPVLKSFLAVSTLLICVVAKSIPLSLLILTFMGIVTVSKGGTPLILYLKMFRIPLVFLILSTLALIINISTSPFSEVSQPLFYIPIGKGDIYLSTYKLSVLLALRLIITALGAVSCLYFLSLTTTVTDLLYVLEKIHCPSLFIELLLLIYRFIFILYAMASALTVSQKCRLVNKNLRTSIQGAGGLWVMLFIYSLKKSSALYDAMEARCYDGSLRFLHKEVKATRKEILGVALIEVMFILAAFIAPF